MKPGEAPFELGEWLVQPQLNRLTRSNGEHVQLEPKMMDVLVCLARHPGEVISRQELIDAVWPDLFITESVLTRAIAGLRRALGDDARKPRFIETIAKRGYRLLAAGAPAPATATAVARAGIPGGSYVVGQWVRGEGFYGRGSQLREVLDGPRNGYWVVGTRRRGKTSFLKQLEHLAAAESAHRLVPVFWDLEGADDEEALASSFEDALADAGPRLADAGIEPDDESGADVVRRLGTLRRRLHADGQTLLLLCDEAEELLAVASRSQATIRRLRRALLAHDGMRTVLASGPRLWDLASGGATSPFLDGFLPPLYLGPLQPSTARDLVRQSRLAADARPDLSDADVEAICRWGGGHPFLLQLLSKRVVECGDLEQGVVAVAADRSVTTLFDVDLDLLDDNQRSLVCSLAHPDEPSNAAGTDATALLELQRLGLVETDVAGRPRIALPLLREWLAGQMDRRPGEPREEPRR
jgi:DNA-binding winged helix-turn-helix (wHTH) protein